MGQMAIQLQALHDMLFIQAELFLFCFVFLFFAVLVEGIMRTIIWDYFVWTCSWGGDFKRFFTF